MGAQLASWAVLAVFVALAVGTADDARISDSPDPAHGGVSRPGVPPDDPRTLLTDGGRSPEPPPEADYYSLESLHAAGESAADKTALVRVWRGRTEPEHFTAYPCADTGFVGWAELRFDKEQAARVRAIPPSLIGDCPRVRFRVTGLADGRGEVRGKVLEILDVQPADEPERMPHGVDYVSTDAINMDGDEAEGKVGRLSFYRGEIDDRHFTAYPCDDHGGIQFLYMRYQPDRREDIEDFPTSPLDTCQELHFRLIGRDRFSGVWRAELLEIESRLP